MKTSEIKKEANKIIKQVFWFQLKSDNKEVWKIAFKAISNHIAKLKCNPNNNI